MTAVRELPDEAMIAACWEAGDLGYLLHPYQAKVRAFLQSAPGRIGTLRGHRRLGKTHLFVTDANELGITREKHVLKYAAPTAKDAREIVHPHFETIRDDAPTRLRPHWNGLNQHWIWPSGTTCQVAGADNRAQQNRLRGRALHRAYLDEIGSIPDLGYLIRSVLLPQTATTNGDLWLASSPSDSPAHDSTDYFLRSEARARGVVWDVYDSLDAGGHLDEETIVDLMLETIPSMDRETAERHVRERTWPDDPEWLREYGARIVTDPIRAVVPEFGRFRDQVVRDFNRPEYYLPSVIMDVGFKDMTVAAFCWVHNGVLHIEDEMVFQRTRSTEIDAAIAKRESELWAPMYGGWSEDDAERRLHRWADAQPMVISELEAKDGRRWGTIDNREPDAAVNAVRKHIPHKIRIHPRCTTIIAHAEHAIWKANRSGFERVGGHHFDGLATLMYAVRHARWNANPNPPMTHGLNLEHMHIVPGGKKPHGELLKVFKGRR